MADKALKLEVTWPGERTKRLCVKTGHSRPELRRPYKVDDCRFPVGDHVEQSETDIVVKNFFGQINRVPDVIRYRICAEGYYVHPDDGRYDFCNNRYIIPCSDVPVSQLQPGNIVLLLESPHEHEYIDGNIARRKKPACGKTGHQIDLCLGTVLLHIQIETGILDSDCHVVISNPIQFQTSLHAIHEQELDGRWTTLRNNVWWALWDESHIKECFLARLESYHPTVIINACTSELKPCVTSCVQEWNHGRNPAVPLYKIDHPSNWENLRPKLINPRAIPNAGNPH